jgi:hypothetical protein
MAYKTVVNKSVADRMAFWDEISAALVSMGWTVFDAMGKNFSCLPANVNITDDTITISGHNFVNGDRVLYSVSSGGTAIAGLTSYTMYFVVNVSGDTFKLSSTQGGAAINLTSQGVGTHYFGEGQRVYSSDGEDADRIPGFVKIYVVGATDFRIDGYYYWDASTHSGLGKSYSYASIVSDGQHYVWIYGNKNFVALVTKVGTSYDIIFFGHLPKRLWTLETYLTASATSGLNVSIEVASTSGFKANTYYQIMGAAGEGRDRILVSSITDSTHMVISNLPRNYGADSVIGQTPCTFMSYGSSPYPTCDLGATGTGNATTTGVRNIPVTNTSVDPDGRAEGKYVLQPIFIAEGGTNNNILGYIDEFFLDCSSVGMNNEDTLGVGDIDSGTAESGAASSLTDGDKAWATDVHADKVLIIISGTGAGQIRKISGNTGTVLSVTPDFVTPPSSDSVYGIYDEGYRFFTGKTIALREGV